MTRTLLLSLLTLATTVGGLADPAAGPRQPTLPLVQPIGRNAHFIVTLQKPASPSTAPASPGAQVANPAGVKSADITITGNVEKADLTLNSGAQQTYWMIGQTIFYQDDAGQLETTFFSPVCDPGFLHPMQKTFYGTAWISLQNYQGVVTHDGESCYFYSTADPFKGAPSEDTPPDPAQVASPGADLPWKAWINIRTNLPTAVQILEGIATYEILSPPTEDLQPPVEISQAIEQAREKTEMKERAAETR